MLLSLADFKLRAGITDTAQDYFLIDVLEGLSSTIELLTGVSFSLIPNLVREYQGAGSQVICIGAWQPAGLTITSNIYGYVYPFFNVVNQDYKLIYPNFKNEQIVALKSLIYILDSNFYLTVSGTMGWSSTVPNDIRNLLYNTTFTAMLWNKYLQSQYASDGGFMGFVQSERDLTSSISYGSIPQNFFNNASKIASGDLMSVPEIAKVLNNYIIETNQTFKIG
jgi:hypothetical protein